MGTDMGSVSLSAPIPPLDAVRAIAGFWRRTAAFIIDSIILAIPEFAIGAMFSDLFSYANGWATLIGLAIQVFYFGILASSVGRGTTVGQRLMDIQVVDQNGAFLPVGKSMLRYFVLFAPFLLATPAIRSLLVLTAYSSVIAAVQGTIIYLYIFNKRTRQSLHDLAAHAFVVRNTDVGRPDAKPFWLGHWAILGGLACVAVVGGLLLFPKFSKGGTFGELIPIREAVLNSGRVYDAGVYKQWNSFNGTTTTNLQVNVLYKHRPDDYDRAARDIAEIVYRTAPNARENNYLSVVFQEGFKVGLASFTKTRVVRHTPAEWIGSD